MRRQCFAGQRSCMLGATQGRSALKLSPAVSLVALWLLAGAPRAPADETVNVSLEDASEGGNLAGMKMTATPHSVKAGPVTIHATNKSQALVHEVIIVRPPSNGAAPPASRVHSAFVLHRAHTYSFAISRTTTKQGCGPNLPLPNNRRVSAQRAPGSFYRPPGRRVAQRLSGQH
jgi:hypothetical protein